MNRDRLFIETLNDLEGRLRVGRSEYDVLGISALIRKLLIDSDPLVDQVNRQRGRKLNLRFRANVAPPMWSIAGLDPATTIWSQHDGFDPEMGVPGTVAADLSRDRLLAHVVMMIRGHEVTVKDVVLQAANVAGAVHAGRPRTPGEMQLAGIGSEIHIGGYPASVGLLLAIGRVVVRGLHPLREKVLADPQP